MKSWELREAFGLEHLTLVDRERERLGPGQVRLKMRAAALNYRDLLVARGQYDPRQKLPYVPLSDGVGEVVEIAEGVTRVAVGERALGCFAVKSNKRTNEKPKPPFGADVFHLVGTANGFITHYPL